MLVLSKALLKTHTCCSLIPNK